ncbi:MAG: GNAT family N-acetyltransferase [Pseudomonadota bacterium]
MARSHKLPHFKMRSIPNINTARLSLRGMRPDDFDRYAHIWSMPEVVRQIGGTPWSRGQAWTSFLRNAGHWQMTGFGQWAIVEQGSRTIIGQTGFFYVDRKLDAELGAYPEAGWMLTPDVRGKGYAYEAAKAAHEWLDRVIPTKLVAVVAPGNAASVHLAKALNYQPVRDAEIEGRPVVLYLRSGP